MLKIYIGNDFDGNPIGVLLADSQSKAEIAWAAMKDTPHTIEEINPETITGINGLVFLLSSIQCNSNSDFGYKSGGVDFRKWVRGI